MCCCCDSNWNQTQWLDTMKLHMQRNWEQWTDAHPPEEGFLLFVFNCVSKGKMPVHGKSPQRGQIASPLTWIIFMVRWSWIPQTGVFLCGDGGGNSFWWRVHQPQMVLCWCNTRKGKWLLWRAVWEVRWTEGETDSERRRGTPRDPEKHRILCK